MTTLLALLVVAAPVPKAKVVLYHPTTEGTTWVYLVGKSEQTEVVTAVKEGKDGAVIVTVARQFKDRLSPYSVVEVSARGLFRVSTGLAPLDPPRCLLKLPAKAGDAWEHVPATANQGLKAKYEVKGEEEVEVPAGKFKAIRIEAVLEAKGGPTPTTYWYAPNVGRVKTVSKEPTGERVEVLKAFTPGKAKGD